MTEIQQKVKNEEIKGEGKSGKLDKGDMEALNRVMKLQKRALRSQTPKKPRASDSEYEKEESGSQSRRSRSSRSSSKSVGERGSGTQLTPPGNEMKKEVKEEPGLKPRRKSTGSLVEPRTADMLPFELAKRPIRPLMVPLASQCVDLPAHASAENEFMVGKLDAIEESKDPNRQWTKTTKYIAYAARGFGTFSPTIGLGCMDWIYKKLSEGRPTVLNQRFGTSRFAHR